MYLYKLPIVFVQIDKYICPNCKIYLSQSQLFQCEYPFSQKDKVGKTWRRQKWRFFILSIRRSGGNPGYCRLQGITHRATATTQYTPSANNKGRMKKVLFRRPQREALGGSTEVSKKAKKNTQVSFSSHKSEMIHGGLMFNLCPFFRPSLIYL